MVFSGLTFLYIFFPAALLLYYLCPNIRWRNGVLLVTSLLFYAWGEPVYILLMLVTAFVNYLLGLLLARCQPRSAKAKVVLWTSAALTLASLGFFKYADFLVDNINVLFHADIPGLELALPIGISFYSFQILTYVIDVYRGETKVQRSYFRFLMYVTSFHQLIAGPIVRYQTVAEELSDRHVSLRDFSCGIDRFIIGLAKKVLLANACGSVSSQILGADMSQMPAFGAWLGVIFFTFQIYFDFSGYSDMAIGLGRMYGFHYLENFNYPYIARTASEFWRRWHISLGTFFRDYVYIPLGGNRRRQYFNLFVVWALTGLWHGASWNFVLWGLYFFCLIALEKWFLGGVLKKLPKVVSHVYLLLAVVLGWALFYYTDLTSLGGCFAAMFGANGAGFMDFQAKSYLQSNLFLLLAAAVFSTPLLEKIWNRLTLREDGSSALWGDWLRAFFNALILILCTAMLVGESYNPFLYFRF